MNVMIAIPNKGTIHVQLAAYLVNEILTSKNTIAVYFEGRNDICRARNAIVKKFRETNFDFLFMLDEDTVPPVGSVDLMAEQNKDLLAGVYFRWGDNNEQDVVPIIMGARKTETGMVANRAGTGCLMVKKGVFEEMEKNSKYPPFSMVYQPDGADFILSEDLHFCEMARECGFELHVETRVVCDHWKTTSPTRLLTKRMAKKEL